MLLTSSGTEPLTKYQNLIRGAIAEQHRRSKDDKWHAYRTRASIRSALLRTRERLPRADRSEFFAWLNKLSQGLGPEFYAALSKDLTGQIPDTHSLSLENELEWIGYRLSAHVGDIRRFRSLVANLDSAFWGGDWDAISQALDVIAEQCGQSVWLLEAQLAFEQEFQGLEAQKALLTSIRQRYPGGLPTYLAFYYSVRNEARSAYRLFHEDYLDRLTASKLKPALRIYLEYKVLGRARPNAEALSSILRFEQGQSIYDVYETTIDLLQRVLGLPQPPPWIGAAEKLLKSLECVDDWRVAKMLSALGVRPESSDEGLEATPVALPPKLSIGQFPVQAFWCLLQEKTSFGELEGEARSGREETLTSLLRRTIERADQFEDSLGRLVKFARNFDFLSTPKALGVIADFLTVVPISGRSTIGVASLNDPGVAPSDLLVRRAITAHSDANEWHASVGEHEARKWEATQPPTESPALAPFEWYLHALRLGDQDPTAALDILGDIPKDVVGEPQRLVYTNLELKMLLDAGDWRSAVAVIAREIARNSRFSSIAPVKEALADRDWETLLTVPDKLDLALALYAYWRQTDDSLHATFLRFAFEEVLFDRDLELPSSLTINDLRKDSRLAFFLEHVCIPALMDTSGFFITTAELLDERLKILSLLVDAVDLNEQFQDEIADIQAAIMIKSGLELVDSNRIAVDVPALTRWASRKYRQSYSRYQALQIAGIGINAKFEEIMEQVRSAVDLNGEYFSIPKSEADTLLLEIILGLKDQFLTDPQYGLEYFLGKRVRHGTIAGHMRSPVEVTRLITERRSATSPYEPNNYWLDRITFAGAPQRAAASLAFDQFSERYDRLIGEVRDTYLHVKSSSHPSGLFDIAVSAPQFHILKALSASDVGFEHFVEVCFQTFWALLGPSLTEAREFLTVKTRSEVIQQFGELQTALEQAGDTLECSRNVAIAIQGTSTDVQRELDTVGSWFERVEGRNIHSFSLKVAIEIAVQSSLKSLGTFRPQMSFDIPAALETTQSFLLVLWEFVFVTLDNAFRRARAGNEPKIELRCEVDEAAKKMRLTIVNPLGSNLDLADVERKLQSTREKIAAGDIIRGASADRGSGLLKVASVVREYPSGSLEFGIDHSSFQFTTRMELPIFITSGGITLQIPESIGR